MPFKWDADSEKNLLLAAISVMGNPPTAIWDAVAEKISGEAGIVNGNACSQKFYKLKKAAEDMLTGGVGAINEDAATPAKPKTSASKGARKRKGAEANDDGETATPTKRAKAKKTAPAASAVKEEDAEVKTIVTTNDGEAVKGEQDTADVEE